MNCINEIREKVKAEFSPNLYDVVDEFEMHYSKDKNYSAKEIFLENKISKWKVSQIEIRDINQKVLLNIILDNEDFRFHEWIETEYDRYLVFAENQCGGQSILNLKKFEFNSFADGTDGFINCFYHLSPDYKTLAIQGCYWACPDIIKIFDFTDPMSLPFKEIKEIWSEKGEHVSFINWEDNHTIKVGIFEDLKINHEKSWCVKI